MSDANGNYVANSQVQYTPFGAFRTTPTVTKDSRFYTGHQANNLGSGAADDLGLIYMNARYYLPGLGRFASADTIVPDPLNPQQYNRYTYVLNNPIRYQDPSGHCVFGLPCPERIRNGLDAVADFTAGVVMQVAHDNALAPTIRENLAVSPNESNAMLTGRVVGGVVTTVQGVVEGFGGVSMAAGGVAACGTGVGCVVSPGAIASGAAVTAHGTLVAGNSVAGRAETISILMTHGSGNSSHERRPLQAGGRTFSRSTARALNRELGLDYSAREYGDALEALKEFNNVPGNVHGQIMSDGAYRVEIDNNWTDIDNIQNFLP